MFNSSRRHIYNIEIQQFFYIYLMLKIFFVKRRQKENICSAIHTTDALLFKSIFKNYHLH